MGVFNDEEFILNVDCEYLARLQGAFCVAASDKVASWPAPAPVVEVSRR